MSQLENVNQLSGEQESLNDEEKETNYSSLYQEAENFGLFVPFIILLAPLSFQSNILATTLKFAELIFRFSFSDTKCDEFWGLIKCSSNRDFSLSPFNSVFRFHFLLVFQGIMTGQETQSHWYNYVKIRQMKCAMQFIATSAK